MFEYTFVLEDQTWIKRVAGGHHHVVVVGVLAQTIHGNSIPEKGKILTTMIVT